MDDGSYFVWIPRFKYKIGTEPNIDVIFVSLDEKSGATANGSTYTTTKESFTDDGDSTEHCERAGEKGEGV